MTSHPQDLPRVSLRRKRADVLNLYRHPWVFSNGLVSRPDLAPGTVVRVTDERDNTLGQAFYHPKNPICLRMTTFGEHTPDWTARLKRAYDLRRDVLPNARHYRLIHGENDGFPGLTVDIFDQVAVLAVTSAGMEPLREQLAVTLSEITGVKAVYERSEGHARKREGLPNRSGFLLGDHTFPIEVTENGLIFSVNPATDHKTGFYLDQRAQRAHVAANSKGKRVLDLCCYNGGFTLAALAGGAAEVHSYDTSATVLEALAANLTRNNLTDSCQRSVRADVFKLLAEEAESRWDTVILDPPSLAKTVKAADSAQKAYRRINRGAAQRVQPGGALLTFSCTGVVTAEAFHRAVFLGIRDSGREAVVTHSFDAGPDHPVSLYFPAGRYLKGYALKIF